MENAVLGQAWARGTTHAQGTKAAEKKTDPWVSFPWNIFYANSVYFLWTYLDKCQNLKLPRHLFV